MIAGVVVRVRVSRAPAAAKKTIPEETLTVSHKCTDKRVLKAFLS